MSLLPRVHWGETWVYKEDSNCQYDPIERSLFLRVTGPHGVEDKGNWAHAPIWNINHQYPFPASVRETSWKYCQYIQVFWWPWITFLTPQLSCIWFSFLFSQYWNLSMFKYYSIFNTTSSWWLAVGLLIIQYSLLKFFALLCPPVFCFFGFVVVFLWFFFFETGPPYVAKAFLEISV